MIAHAISLLGVFLLALTLTRGDEPARKATTFQGKPVSFWVKQLHAKDVAARQEAARVLALVGSEIGDGVPALIAALDDSDQQVRWRILEALAAAGPKAEAAVPVLVQFFNDRDEQWRDKVLQTVGAIGTKDDKVVLALTAALLDERPRFRSLAAGKVLARLGPDAKAALPLLRETLKHKDTDLRAAVLLPLASIDAEGLGTVVSALDDPEAKVRQAASAALKELGPKAKPAVAPLLKRLRNRERSQETVQLLAAIGSEALPALVAALKDSEIGPGVPDAIAAIGPSAVPLLLDAIKDKDARKNALEALARLGSAGRDDIPALLSLLKDADAPTRTAVQAALARMGKGVLSQVVAGLKDLDNEQIPGLVVHLSQGAEGIRQAVPALVRLLRDPEARVRIRAAQQLGKFGLQARRAAPALEELRKDDNELVHRAAEEALKQIGRVR